MNDSTDSTCEALSRRNFLGALVQIGAGGALALSGCTPSQTPAEQAASGDSNGAPDGKDGPRGAGPIPVAAQKDGAAWRVAGGAKVPAGQALFFEIRDGGDKPRTGYLLQQNGKWLALDAKCPHAGCDVEWKTSAFQCPCHNSGFTSGGKRTGGPAERDLARWKVQIQNDDALIWVT